MANRARDQKVTVVIPFRNPRLKDLVGKSLDKFNVQEYTEVYKTDEGGRKTKSLGYFEKNEVAVAFAANQIDRAYHETNKVFLLTNGKIAFVIGEYAALVDGEKALLAAQEAALAKLSATDRKLLGR